MTTEELIQTIKEVGGGTHDWDHGALLPALEAFVRQECAKYFGFEDLSDSDQARFAIYTLSTAADLVRSIAINFETEYLMGTRFKPQSNEETMRKAIIDVLGVLEDGTALADDEQRFKAVANLRVALRAGG